VAFAADIDTDVIILIYDIALGTMDLEIQQSEEAIELDIVQGKTWELEL
jgi:hypothetical protein